MRQVDVGSGGAPSPLSSDLHRDLGARVGQLGQAGLEGLSVWIARRVLAHRFIDWVRNSEVSVGGHLDSSLLLLSDASNRNPPPYPTKLAVKTVRRGSLVGLIPSSDARPAPVQERIWRTVALLGRRGYALSPERLAAMCIGGAISPREVRWTVAASPDLVIADDLVLDRAELARIDQIRSRARGHRADAGAYVEMTARFVRALVAMAPFIRSVSIAGSLASGGFRASDDV